MANLNGWYNLTLEDVFRILDTLEPNEFGCVTWPRQINNRYCRIRTKEGVVLVSRLVLERKLGRPIRPGYLALHTCDWPPCINSDHLYEGTRKDNMKDYAIRNPKEYHEHLAGLHSHNTQIKRDVV